MNFRFRTLDVWLALPIFLLMALGTLTLYSAGRDTAQAGLWIRQSMWNGIGLLGMFLLSGIDQRRVFRNSLPIYLMGLLSLVLVLILGKTIAGSKSWIQVGGITLQPSELVKWLTLLFVAHRLGSRPMEAVTLPELIGAAGLVLFPMLLVLKQPDLGVALTFTPIFLLLLLIRGLRWRWVALGLTGFMLFSGAAWKWHLKHYQKERVLTFLDPARDLKGKGYQVHQSRIAIGAGGIFGRGYMSGSQTQLNFLPVKTTDFVFSVWAEERGYAGVLLVLGLFGLLLHRMLGIAATARSTAASYFCAGSAAIFALHILINAGMVAGVVPTTGIPLPFFTYGGSATVSFFLALGLIMNIQHQAKMK